MPEAHKSHVRRFRVARVTFAESQPSSSGRAVKKSSHLSLILAAARQLFRLKWTGFSHAKSESFFPAGSSKATTRAKVLNGIGSFCW
jgi:hypothetical protein